MSLMFLLSGLFVSPSLSRKGNWIFLSDRLLRIGMPLLFVVLLLMPIAYHPAYRATALDPGAVGPRMSTCAKRSGFLQETVGSQFLPLRQFPQQLFSLQPSGASSSRKNLQSPSVLSIMVFAAPTSAWRMARDDSTSMTTPNFTSIRWLSA
jgi:hypothetical protein